MRKMRIAILMVAVVMLVSTFAYKLNTPEKQVQRFVDKHSAELTELLDAGKPLPADLAEGYSCRDAEHPMDEFIITTMGDVYYGCYYSPAGVPLAFQNSGLELVDDVRGGWSWRAEGDNYGYTEELLPGWYYFDARF